AHSVGGHDGRVADPDLGVHHLVAGRRRHALRAAGLAVGAVLVAHQHAGLGAERLAVEIERLFGAALEEEVGEDGTVHGQAPSFMKVFIRSTAGLAPKSSSAKNSRTSISASPPSMAGLGKRLVHTRASSRDLTSMMV